MLCGDVWSYPRVPAGIKAKPLATRGHSGPHLGYPWSRHLGEMIILFHIFVKIWPYNSQKLQILYRHKRIVQSEGFNNLTGSPCKWWNHKYYLGTSAMIWYCRLVVGEKASFLPYSDVDGGFQTMFFFMAGKSWIRAFRNFFQKCSSVFSKNS